MNVIKQGQNERRVMKRTKSYWKSIIEYLSIVFCIHIIVYTVRRYLLFILGVLCKNLCVYVYVFTTKP